MSGPMTTQALEQPLLDDGIATVNYFNGRLLTARDLRREQEARRAFDRRAGQAIGTGVAFGLRVAAHSESTDGDPKVVVGSGLAINALGQTLATTTPVTLALVRRNSLAAGTANGFGLCESLGTGTYVAGPGVYLLTIAPASATSGKAPTSGLDMYGGACNTDSLVETAQFRLLALDMDIVQQAVPVAEAKAESLFRNFLAAYCFGAPGAAGADPFATAGADPLGAATGAALTRCDVPLALLYWTLSGGLRFVDEWSVRRGVWQPAPEDLPRLGPWAAIASLGEARLLQFVAHLRDLLRAQQGSTLRIEEYFRYVPPAAFFPASGAGSAGGVSTSGFLGAFTTGTTERVPAATAAAILSRSFHFAMVDLSAAAFLQVYRVIESEQAVAAGASAQQHRLYVSRSMHGPASRDGATAAFEDAWVVFRGLGKRRVFLPVGSTPEEVAAQISIVGALRDVLDQANRQAARAGSWALDTNAAVEAFAALYAVQQDLNLLLATDIPGTSDLQERKLFTSVFDAYLNQSLPGGRPSLKRAVDNGSLLQAITAQEAINQFVGKWSGEGVAVGPFGFTFSRSEESELVPGAARSAQVFRLNNGTGQTLTMRLAAQATAPTGSWSGATRILGSVGGSEIDSATLARGASREVVVMIGAPADARVGEDVTLTLSAEVGPPTNRTSSYTMPPLLKVSASGGGPVTGTVQIAQHRFQPPNLDASNVTSNQLFALRLSVVYSSGDQAARDFNLDIQVQGGDASAWGFSNESTGTALSPNATGDGFTLPLADVRATGTPVVAGIRIQAPAASNSVNRSVTLGFSISSVGLPVPITHRYGQTIQFVVRRV